jgi:long-chain acyl-CoA synthetase
VFDTKWITALTKYMSRSSEPSMQSVPVGDDPAHRVRPEFKSKRLDKPSTNAATLYEIVRDSCSNFPNQIAMRKREFLGMKSPKVKEFAPEAIEYTYEQVGNMAHKFGAALRAHGMTACPNTTDLDKNTKPCRMAIFENTCAEWMIATMGAFTQSIAVTTVYATLVRNLTVANAFKISSVSCILTHPYSFMNRALMQSLKPLLIIQFLSLFATRSM